jgi:hypothetical protein
MWTVPSPSFGSFFLFGYISLESQHAFEAYTLLYNDPVISYDFIDLNSTVLNMRYELRPFNDSKVPRREVPQASYSFNEETHSGHAI